MTSIDVISIIVKENPSIESCAFHNFPQQKFVQDCVGFCGKDEEQMIDYALGKKKEGIPFWDGIMLSAFNNENYAEEILKLALRHNKHTQLTFVHREQLLSRVNTPVRTLDYVAICSRVIMVDKEERHLPLIDFHIPVSDKNAKVAESVCRLLELGEGWLLNSGESYHFIGSDPRRYEDLEMLLYKALMFTPIIDKAWISHQLREHSCSLRIGEKRGMVPTVVKRLK